MVLHVFWIFCIVFYMVSFYAAWPQGIVKGAVAQKKFVDKAIGVARIRYRQIKISMQCRETKNTKKHHFELKSFFDFHFFGPRELFFGDLVFFGFAISDSTGSPKTSFRRPKKWKSQNQKMVRVQNDVFWCFWFPDIVLAFLFVCIECESHPGAVAARVKTDQIGTFSFWILPYIQ